MYVLIKMYYEFCCTVSRLYGGCNGAFCTGSLIRLCTDSDYLLFIDTHLAMKYNRTHQNIADKPVQRGIV